MRVIASRDVRPREGMIVVFDKEDCEFLAEGPRSPDGFDVELSNHATRWLEDEFPRPLARRVK